MRVSYQAFLRICGEHIDKRALPKAFAERISYWKEDQSIGICEALKLANKMIAPAARSEIELTVPLPTFRSIEKKAQRVWIDAENIVSSTIISALDRVRSTTLLRYETPSPSRQVGHGSWLIVLPTACLVQLRLMEHVYNCTLSDLTRWSIEVMTGGRL